MFKHQPEHLDRPLLVFWGELTVILLLPATRPEFLLKKACQIFMRHGFVSFRSFIINFLANATELFVTVYAALSR